MPASTANCNSERMVFIKFLAAAGMAVLATTIFSMCWRCKSAIRLSPCSARKRSKMLRRVRFVSGARLWNASELKYPTVSAAMVPGLVRLAPISMRGAVWPRARPGRLP